MRTDDETTNNIKKGGEALLGGNLWRDVGKRKVKGGGNLSRKSCGVLRRIFCCREKGKLISGAYNKFF